MRLMQELEVPAPFEGQVMSVCFDVISSPSEKPAVKAFALTVLENLSTKYPEIKDELVITIETQWPHASAAFRSRGKKILDHLKKDQQR